MIERRVFRYPLEPCPKVAVVCDTLRLSRNCHFVKANSRDWTAMDTLAAPANWQFAFDPGDWRPAFPLVAFTGVQHGFLDEEDREQLWLRFGVPLFEQLLDHEGHVAAVECEAHASLHLEPGVRHSFAADELIVDGRPTGISSQEAKGMCGCGRPGPRLTDVCAIVSVGIHSNFDTDLGQLSSVFSRIT